MGRIILVRTAAPSVAVLWVGVGLHRANFFRDLRNITYSGFTVEYSHGRCTVNISCKLITVNVYKSTPYLTFIA